MTQQEQQIETCANMKSHDIAMEESTEHRLDRIEKWMRDIRVRMERFENHRHDSDGKASIALDYLRRG